MLYFYSGFYNNYYTRKGFMSWQTWDLLRLMYYGFKNLCGDFTSAHPGYTMYLECLNGSAIETFFSQVKQNVNGKLRRQLYYRNAPLFI